ncbi:DNA-binding transcriptional activator of the SARP family protein [Marinibacterium anthonyi]|nr:DNA-binding transcriptional activator of the SARP family protein [Marinibacterium anthonyi]
MPYSGLDSHQDAESQETKFRLLVCSQCRLFWGHKEVIPPGQKTRALLSYLVLESHREHSREATSGLFWGTGDTRLARASLRQALLQINRAFGDQAPFALRQSRSDISVDPVFFTTDLDLLQANLRSDVPNLGHDSRIADVRHILPGLDGIS